MQSWKRDVASGLVVLVPLMVLLWVLNWFFSQLTALPFISGIRFADLGIPPTLIPVVRVLIALAVFVMLVFAVGYLMRTTAGRLGERLLDDTINRIPGLRVVYNASKLAVETALTGTDELQKPVRLETWPGMRMTAFKTGKTTDDGREVVFMPTAPNITTGFVIEVDEDDLEETDEKVEEALTRILSAGFGEKSEGVPIEVSEEEEAG